MEEILWPHGLLACNAFFSHFWQLLVNAGNSWSHLSRVALQLCEDVAHWGEDDEEDEGGGEEHVAQHVHGEEELAHHAAGGVPED